MNQILIGVKFSTKEWIYFEFPFNNQSLRIGSILDKIDKIIYENNNSESINNEEFQLSVYKTILPFFKYSMNYTDIGSFLIFYHIKLAEQRRTCYNPFHYYTFRGKCIEKRRKKT